MKGFKTFFCSILAVMLLSACGGGGDGGSSSPSPGDSSSGDTDTETYYQVTDYEFPAYQEPNSITGLANGEYMVIFNTGIDEEKAQSLMAKVVSLIGEGKIQAPVSPGNVRTDISMDRLVLVSEDENGYQYTMPEYEGLEFEFDHAGETTAVKVQTLYVMPGKFPAINFKNGYDDMPNGPINFTIDIALGEHIVAIANTHSNQDYDTGQMTRSYSDYANFDESMVSNAFWSRISDELKAELVKDDSIFQSFHDMHCTYVGDGLLGLTRLKARDFYMVSFENPETSKEDSLMTEVVAYKDDIKITDSTGEDHLFTEVKVRAVANITDDIFFNKGIEEVEFKRTQKLIDEHGLYSYHLHFKYNDIYGDVQCKRKN